MRVIKRKTRKRWQCPLCDLYSDGICNIDPESKIIFPDHDDSCWDNEGGRYYFKFVEQSSNTIVI